MHFYDEIHKSKEQTFKEIHKLAKRAILKNIVYIILICILYVCVRVESVYMYVCVSV